MSAMARHTEVGDTDAVAPAAAARPAHPLDRFARLAAASLRAPVALIALREAGRPVLGSAVGLPPDFAVDRGELLDDGVLVAACASVAPLAVADLRAEPRLRDGAVVAASGAVAVLAVALPGRTGEPHGALCVFDVRPRAWSGEERALVAELAAAAGHERESGNELLAQAALRHVATAVAHGAEPEAVCALVAEAAARAVESEAGAVVRYEDERSARVLGTWGAEGIEPLPEGTVLAVEGEGIAASMRRGLAARADSAPGHRPFRHRIGAPVLHGTQVWGFVGALSNQAPPAAAAEHRLAPFAELVGAAIRNAETRTQLATQATTDALTGLANQRAFHRRLAAEAERARRHGRNLALALFDVDGFKLVNDTYGHPIGDEVLCGVARRIAGVVRAGELVARIGGDELALLLPETDAQEAYGIAERVRELIEEAPIGRLRPVTLSGGVSDLEDAGGDPEALMRGADDALYWAKAQGRNVVARYAPELGERFGERERAEHVGRGQVLLGIGALARAVDAKDPVSERHSERVAELAVRLARATGWPVRRLALLREAALVHDVGKIGLPEELLTAPDPTPGQAQALEQHARLGAEIAAEVLSGQQVAWIRHHHERADGRGYPDGLLGEAIPHGARVIAVADAWDAMTSPSARRTSLSPEEALAECRAGAGTQFAADVVGALERVLLSGELAPAWAASSAISLGA
jgi:diguanylate cyclase (GGDEF)-like protein/putative nucleotidyltransferase with HDIG domain